MEITENQSEALTIAVFVLLVFFVLRKVHALKSAKDIRHLAKLKRTYKMIKQYSKNAHMLDNVVPPIQEYERNMNRERTLRYRVAFFQAMRLNLSQRFNGQQ